MNQLIKICIKCLITILIPFIHCSLAFTQKEGNIWYFGINAGLDFNSGSPVTLNNGALNTLDNAASISDSNGQILFYTNGMTVYNKNHVAMFNGTGLLGHNSSGQSAIIVSQPTTSFYYIFTVDYFAGANGLRYSVVDMSQQGGLGAVTTKNILLSTPTTEKLDAIYNNYDTSYWVLTHDWGSAIFSCYKINKYGLDFVPVTSNVGSVNSGGTPFGYNAVGQMTFSRDGTKVVSAIQYDAKLELFDFNMITGVLSNPRTITGVTNIWGTAFSPDGSKLYISQWFSANITQYNLNAGSLSAIIASATIVGSASGVSPYNAGYLQLGPNDKIYIARWSMTYLAVINSPNSLGSSCNFVSNGISLGSKTCQAGLCRIYLKNTLKTGVIRKPICAGDTLSVPYTINSSLFSTNIFTAQLSDSTGNFGSPINIGTLTKINSGKIIATIPKNTKYGTKYKIRVISSFPVLISLFDSIYLTIYPSPYSGFNLNDSTQCLKSNFVSFANNSTISSGSYSSFWKFGNGDTSNIKNPNYSYLVTGTFNVRLITTSNAGCTDSLLHKVYIYPDPIVGYSINNAAQCLKGNNFIFTNISTISTGSLTYVWNFGDNNTVNTNNASHSYLIENTYSVKLVAISNLGCKDSITNNIDVYPAPISGYSINNSGQCLKGNNLIFTNNSTISSGTISSSWKFGDGNTANTNNATHSYLTASTYGVKLIAISNFGCKDSVTKNVNIYPTPTAGYSINFSSQCLNGNNLIFSNNSTISSGTLTSAWNFGDGYTASSNNSTHSYLTVDTYSVRLVVNSNFGCKDTITKNIYIYPNPTADFSINDTTQCLNGNQFIFTNLSSIKSGLIVQNNWDFQDNTGSSNTNPSKVYLIAGDFSVKLVATSDHNCKDSTTYLLKVLPQPDDSFSSVNGLNGLVTFTSYAGLGHTYKWNFGDGDSSTLENPVHQYKINKTYIVKVQITNTYGCITNGTNSVIITNATGIGDKLNADKILVYPNPANDKMFIDLPEGAFNKSATIYSLNGKQIMSSNLTSKHSTLDINYFAKGIYMLVIQGEEVLYRTMIIKY